MRGPVSETNMTLFEMAAACGFNSKSSFAKTFARRFGHPPSRAHHRRRAAGERT